MPTLRTPVCGSFVITAGSVMNGAGSPGQQRWIGSRPRSTSSPVSTISWLAPRETDFGSESAIDFSFFRPRTLSAESLRRLHLEHVLELARDVVEPLDAEGHAHTTLGPELVDQQRVTRAARVLEQERRPAALHRPVDDLGDLEVGVDLGGDADELAFVLEQANPVAQVAGRGHGVSVETLVRAAAAVPHRARQLAEGDHGDEDQPDDRACR